MALDLSVAWSHHARKYDCHDLYYTADSNIGCYAECHANHFLLHSHPHCQLSLVE
jgi:hypothetical protein